MQRLKSLFSNHTSVRGDSIVRDGEATIVVQSTSAPKNGLAALNWHTLRNTASALCGAGLLLLSASGANAQAPKAFTDKDSVAALDSLFKTLKPEQKLVYIDDMGFKVETLKAWRNALAGGKTTRAAFDNNEQLWPNRRIPYIFDGNMSESYRATVRSAMFTVQKCANVIWVPASGDANYVRFFNNGTSGMNSALGPQGGEQLINIDASLSRIRCAHELAHCMGFIHEQCRSDRDTYVTVTSTSGNALGTVNWAKLPSSRSLNQGPYDYDSMMHYPPSASAGGSSATITPKEPYYTNAGKPTLGQETHVSILDESAMVGRYGAPCVISGRVTTTTGVPMSGLTLTCTPTGNSAYYGPTVTTDANGYYTLLGTATGTYSVTLSGGAVIPVSTTVPIETTSATGVNFTVDDNNRPTISIASPTDGSLAESVTSATGTATDNIGVDYVGVILKNNADNTWWVWDSSGNNGSWGTTTFERAKHFKKVDNPTDSTNFNWTASLPNLSNGSYNLQVISVDIANNDAGAYASLSYSIGTVRPVVTITTPGLLTTIPSLTSLSGTASDPDGISGNVVNLNLIQNNQYWNGTSWQNTEASLIANLSGNVWSTTLVPKGSNLRSGAYLLKARATDTQGNVSADLIGKNIISFGIDNVAPTCDITDPSNGSTLNGVSSISGHADDDVDMEKIDLDILRLSDNKFWDNDHWGDGSATLSCSYENASKEWRSNGPLPYGNSPQTGWASGNYRIIVTVHDNAGNQKQATANFSIINTFLWTGATLRDSDSNNNSTNWDTAANWSPVGIPGASDVAVIANGDTVQADGTHSIGTLGILGSTLNTSGLLVKNLELSGTINGGSINSNGGIWNWYGGSISGNWSVFSGAAFNISSATDMSLSNGTILNNAGTINWSGAGKLHCEGYNNPSTINNQNGGVFNLGADGTPFTTTYSSIFNNASGAKLVKTAGSGATLLSGWTFNNSGELGSNVGTLNYNTTLSLNNGSSITGAAKHEVLGGTVNISGTATVQGSTFTVSNGNIAGVGALAVLATSSGGSWNWNGGSLSNTVANTGTFNISGAATKLFINSAVFNNTGNVTWSGGNIHCEGYNAPAIFNNKNLSVFTATSEGSFTTTYGAIFNNANGATFNRTGTANTQLNWAFNNDGLAKSTAGILTLNAGGSGFGRFQTGTGALIKFNGGSHTLSNSRLLGTGKVQITGGAVTLNGNLTLGDTTSPATLEVSSGSLVGTAVIVNNVLKSNSIIASGNSLPSLLNWTGGVMGGVQTWAASIKTDISDPTTGKTTKTFANSTTINNDGLATWRSAGAMHSEGYRAPVTFNNRNGAVFTFANAGTPFSTTYGSTFDNQAGASIVKNGTGNLTLTSWVFTNAGTVTTNAGLTEFLSTLTLSAGTKFTGVGIARLAGTTNANTAFSSTGPLRLDLGNFNGGASTSFTGTQFNWTGGSINGQFTLNVGSVITVTGTATKSLGNSTVFNNNGSVTWNGPGAIHCEGYNAPATFNNRKGAVFAFATAGVPFTTTYGSTFNNQIGARLVKSGTGILTLTQWGYNSDSEIAATAGTTEFLSTLNLNAGAKFTGTGTTRFAGTINAKAPFSAVGPIRLDAGSLNGTPLASFTGTGFTWAGGSINGQLTLNAGSMIAASGTASKSLGNGTLFNNKGIFKWLGGSSIHNEGYNNPSTFNNMLGATFEVGADGVPFKTTYGSNFNNQAGAKFLKSAGTGQSTVSGWTFNNGSWDGKVLLLGGIIEAKTGTLNFATTLNLRGGTFKGPGQNLWSAGSINVGAPTTIDGTKLTWSGGTLNAVTSGTKASAALSTVGTGNVNWTGGGLTGNLLLAAKSITNISGSAQKNFSNGTVLSNAGLITWTEGNIHCEGYNNPATLKNLAGGTFNVRGKGAFSTTYGSAINNAGLFDLGTNPLTSAWSFTQTSTGTTALNINSAALYGQLKTTNGVTLAGNLNTVFASNYVPAVGAIFKVITHGSRIGTFGKVNVTGNSTRMYMAKYNQSDVSLVVSAKAASPRQASAAATAPTPVPTVTLEAPETPTETPVPTAESTKAPSGSSGLSLGSVNVSASSIQLAFVQNIDAATATNLTHYTVTINGQPVELMGVSVKGNLITLLLPEGTLTGNDSVTAKWDSLKIPSGQLLAPGMWNNGRNPT
ncbi:hypothetical protein EON83_09835 [bacterium]|nr:MAG: hypothetical protein EON83_09835 [bacterium]